MELAKHKNLIIFGINFVTNPAGSHNKSKPQVDTHHFNFQGKNT